MSSSCLTRFIVMILAVIHAGNAAHLVAIEPEIHPDGSATFRIDAPGARELAIDIKGRTSDGNNRQPQLMQKGDDGVWTYTSPPLDPGFHYYFVFVDGFRCADSDNPLYFGWQRPTNGVEIPDPELTCYLPRRVPRGEVRIRPYFSARTGKWREAYVYTPPGYERQTDRRFPVLYLQHGAGENQTSWTNQGRAHVILDNLLADGACEPMLVVMDHGYAEAAGGGPDRRSDIFEQVLVEELIPTIEQHYRVIPERASRAVAGLSRGGGQALRIGLGNLDKFAYLGCFSGAASGIAQSDGAVDASTINSQLKLFWIACGTEDFVIARSQTLHEALDRLGIRHEFVTHPGTHEWQAWRRQLHWFAPKLFREPE